MLLDPTLLQLERYRYAHFPLLSGGKTGTRSARALSTYMCVYCIMGDDSGTARYESLESRE